MDAVQRKVPVITYSRVVGYFSPVQGWNKGKKEEFSQRKTMTAERIRERIEN